MLYKIQDNFFIISCICLIFSGFIISLSIEYYTLLGLAILFTLLYICIILFIKDKVDYLTFTPLFIFSSISLVVAVIPIYYAYLTNSLDIYALEAGPKLWLKGMRLEVIFFISWMFGYFSFQRWSVHVSKKLELKIGENLDYKISVLILIISSILWFVLLKIKPVGYSLMQSETLHFWSSPHVTSLHFLTVISSFFLPSLCVFLLILKRRIPRYFLFFLLFTYFIFALLGGTRFALLIPLVILTVLSIIQKKINIRKVFQYSAFGILIILLIGGIIETYRARTLSAESYADLFNIARYEFNRGYSSRDLFRQNIERTIYRLGTVQVGGLFAEYTDKTGTVGFRPYAGIPLIWIPRYFMPHKPMVGSADGTPLGQHQFIAAYLRSGWIGNSTSVSTSSVMYWHFGWIGIILGGIIAGFLVHFFSLVTLKSGILGEILFIHFLVSTLGFYRNLTSLLTWIWLYFIPIYFIIVVLKIFLPIKVSRT